VRAVIDNNVLVSGLLWGDKPGRVLTAVAEGRVQIFLKLTLKSFEGIPIIAAAEALRRLGLA
jgi:predicted nucleic acid-binding protein